jgi:hypothetical protein
VHTTNYINTFIAVAPDSTAPFGTAPPEKAKPTIANAMYRLLSENPYKYTYDDVLFEVFADRSEVPQSKRAAARKDYFSKPKACLRASDLTKKYGWGAHVDESSKVALYAVESSEYSEFIAGKRKDKAGNAIAVKYAMRSKK